MKKKKKKTRNSKIHLIFYHMNLDEVLPCDILFKKIIEILLNHIIDKNKFKNMDSLFPLVQCFKTFHFSLSHTKLFSFPFTLFTLLFYIHMPTTLHATSSQMKPYKKQYHLPSTYQ